MANWSHLPQELLLQIAKCLETHFDILHLRAICSTWRAFVPYNLLPPPTYSPVFRKTKEGEKTLVLKRTISLFKFPQLHNQATPHFWLVSLEQDDESGKIHTLDPLGNQLKQVKKCPIVLNSSRFHPQDLAHEYVLQVTDEDGTMTVKAAYMNTNNQKFLIFGDHEELGLFKSGDEEPTQIEVEDGSSGYDDFIQFNGKFYVVDTWGRTVVIEHHSGTASPVSEKLTLRGEKNFLVESGGKLLLVTMFSAIIDTNPRKSCWFQVFQLDEEGKIWKRVRSLGDGIMFLGKYCNFYVPGIPGVQGNCIVFTHKILSADGSFKREDDAYVFHMRNQRVVPLKYSDEYLKLLRPPLL